MPIIPTIGRKSPKIRFMFAVLYLLLGAGAITMIYPFVLLLSISITGPTDTNDLRPIPRYLNDDDALFAKYVDDKYAGDIELANDLYRTNFQRGDAFKLPLESPIPHALVVEWNSLIARLPVSFRSAAFRGYGLHPGRLNRMYRDFARTRFGDDIKALNRSYTEENETFNTLLAPQERLSKRNWSPEESPKMDDFQKWKDKLPVDMMAVFAVDAQFAKFLREEVSEYGGKVERAVKDWGVHGSFGEIAAAPSAPAHPAQRAIWERFVRTKLPFRCIKAEASALGAYRQYLTGKYKDIARYNRAYETQLNSWPEVKLPEKIPSAGAINVDWGEFLSGPAPIAALRIDSPENRFRSLLYEKCYSTAPDPGTDWSQVSAEKIGQKYGIKCTSLLDVLVPNYGADAEYVNENRTGLRWEYVTRNYGIVAEYILLHGRAVGVTVFYCLLVIATTLVVNPLCAYALSRFGLPYAHRILLFLLATMSFPAEVAMIPNFLLLKQLGMLNTYAALILPGMANGFSIFLLKGFFDSLPKELYEAGTIDGASETRMFFNLTLPVSRPIFAVIALHAFTGAYGAFMFAFLVCQNPKMWTIMVWLYELQINNPQYIMMAGLAAAALPTLLVFVFAQNIIMRGIILPGEK